MNQNALTAARILIAQDQIDPRKKDFYDLFQDEILRSLKEWKSDIQQESASFRLTLSIGNPQLSRNNIFADLQV